MILQAIAESEKMIKDADIPALQEEFISFIDDYIAQSPGRGGLQTKQMIPELRQRR